MLFRFVYALRLNMKGHTGLGLAHGSTQRLDTRNDGKTAVSPYESYRAGRDYGGRADAVEARRQRKTTKSTYHQHGSSGDGVEEPEDHDEREEGV